MSEQQLIHHMETWLFHQAQMKWKKTPAETAEIFKKYGLFDYIAACYDYLHLSSYEMALESIEALLNNKGALIGHG